MNNIQDKLATEWTIRQVDAHLDDLLFWKERGYVFTEKQIEKVKDLYRRVNC